MVFFQPAELRRDLLALGGGGGVAPKFGGADDLAVLVERHEAMLLPAHADGDDLGGDGLGLAQRLTNGLGGGVAPGVRMLFLRAGRQGWESNRRPARRAEDLAGPGVHDERLGGLRAAVNADEKCSHDKCLTTKHTKDTKNLQRCARGLHLFRT